MIKFESIDLTQILVSVLMTLLIFLLFKNELKQFVASLRERPLEVVLENGKTTIKVGTLVKPTLLTTGIDDPSVRNEESENWDERISYVRTISDFEKAGFSNLYERLNNIGDNEIGILNFSVNDESRPYFKDSNMLKYLSIASEKIRYLAFYEAKVFRGYIKIEKVIKALAAEEYEFQNFGERLKNGDWENFPSLIADDKAFTEIPSIQKLYDSLTNDSLTEIPLLEQGRLIAILTFKTVSDALYEQTKASTETEVSL